MPGQTQDAIGRKVLCGSRFRCPRMGGVVMVIPGCAIVAGAFGTSDCSARTAADSWPHPGLVELPNVVDATPCGRGPPRLVSVMSGAQWMSKCRSSSPVLILARMRCAPVCRSVRRGRSGCQVASGLVGGVTAVDEHADGLVDI